MSEAVNKAWKNTCKILLGDEIGELYDYKNYLRKYLEPVGMKKSAISGNDVAVLDSMICAGATFISNDERGQYEKMVGELGPLHIDEVKDVDSLVGALRERFYYSGNVILGNSTDVYCSDKCTNASCIYNSHMVVDNSRYIAFSNRLRACEYCFGIAYAGESRFSIRIFANYRNARCMEGIHVNYCSDCYFISNLEGCKNCMFSFNQRNRNYLIGNLQLAKEEYAKIKDKLIEDIRETLREKKDIPGIIDIIGGAPKGSSLPVLDEKPVHAITLADLMVIESSFEKTSEIVLGKKFYLNKLEEWLTRNTGRIITSKSAVSGETVYAPPLELYEHIKERFVKLGEAYAVGASTKISEAELGVLGISNATEKLKNISYTTPEEVMGDNINVVECTAYDSSVNGFRNSFFYNSKYAAHSFWPKVSEYVFGCNMVFYCKFCIKCYNSTNLTRCFEVDSSNNCRDSYFCHNCEDLDNCMFCFNTKNKRYAIGNVEVGRENYMKIKKILLTEVCQKLENNALDVSIYNIGCAGVGNAWPK